MIFVNDKEVNLSKSLVLKAFHQVNSIKSFLDLGLPIKQYTKPGNLSWTDMSHYELPTNHVDHNVAFEIDVSHPKRI